jgi:hypothetical protein
MITRMVPRSFIAGVLVSGVLAAAGCGGDEGEQVSPSDRDRAVDEAQAAYDQVAPTRPDLMRGPCISESLPGLPDWVADIAHDPRLPVDDEPANQCRRYRDGEAQHFVELDVNGTLIRAE